MTSFPDTKTSLLNAAEMLFAERGIESTSLRAITSEAQANIAAVNYHFGSKDSLVREVFARRLRPLNAERLRRLNLVEGAAEPPALVEVLDAFIRPVIELHLDMDEGGSHFVRMMGRGGRQRSPVLYFIHCRVPLVAFSNLFASWI